MCFCCVDFFFKQKTAYEMRISDWSSDVCSSDLADVQRPDRQGLSGLGIATWLLRSGVQQGQRIEGNLALLVGRDDHDARAALDRKSVVSGKSVSVRVDLGGRRFIKKKKSKQPYTKKTRTDTIRTHHKFTN